MQKDKLRVAITILITGLSTVISYLINLILTPYITQTLGIEAYGFVSIAKTTVSYAAIITVALTAFIVRFISVSYHTGQMEDAKSYYSSSIAASLLLSGGILAVALVIIGKLEYILNISPYLVTSVKILFIVVFVNFVFSTVTTAFSASFYIRNRLDISGIIRMIAYLGDALVLILLFTSFQPQVWFVGLGSLTATVMIMVCSYGMTRKLTPQLRFQMNLVSAEKIKGMMGNGIWYSLNSLGNILNSGLDLLISNLLLTGTAMGQIAVVKTINTMFTTLYQVIFQPFQPQLIKTYAQGDTDQFVIELEKVMLVCGCFASLAFAGFLSMGKFYYQLWLPGEDILLLYKLTMVAVAISLTEGIMQPVYYVSNLTLKNRLPCFVTIAGGVINVAAMFVLLKKTTLGPFAVVGTTTVIMLCINLFFNPVYAARCLGICAFRIYRILFRHFFAAGGMAASLYLVAQGMAPETWIGFFVCVVPLSVIGIVVYCLLACRRKEAIAFWGKLLCLLGRKSTQTK